MAYQLYCKIVVSKEVCLHYVTLPLKHDFLLHKGGSSKSEDEIEDMLENKDLTVFTTEVSAS